ncbi:conjugal transfer protein TraD [Sphingomonas sp. HITSZ_GF]|uniref:conjugal transfer protein TraD n=1 Tax=Sphingomonas sp. HITSZ_GF TaxID=3037247 RepID=UPI00240CE785|nr:conjugal transfer protein TraD [Sphingomonas sp. HITSZ_GF]MDG2532567.1 conjugal transfer protein TraD [Sphingomonas sp. HITSZ_GF]
MRKPRDYDAELKALTDKARQLREQKLRQLGELVVASGADALPVEQLAGVLLHAVEIKDAATKEGWRKRGAAFFQRAPATSGSTGEQPRGAAAAGSGAASPSGPDRAE